MLTPPPSRPQRGIRATFAGMVDAFVAWFTGTFYNELVAYQANLNSIAFGGAYAIPYTFGLQVDVGTAGGGILAFETSANSMTTTHIWLDIKSAGGSTETTGLDQFDDSTSVIKGTIKLVKAGDLTKWARFNVVGATTSGTFHRGIAVTPIDSSSANPFVAGDPVMLSFTRTGDVGSPGTILRRTTSTASSSTPTPNAGNTDLFVLTALAVAPTFGAPTGAILDGQGLMFRIKDNGTARALAWNTVYRASSDLALPTSTIANKTLYIGFIYNAADTKWDLVSVLNNI